MSKPEYEHRSFRMISNIVWISHKAGLKVYLNVEMQRITKIKKNTRLYDLYILVHEHKSVISHAKNGVLTYHVSFWDLSAFPGYQECAINGSPNLEQHLALLDE